jgi:hypothetical protein
MNAYRNISKEMKEFFKTQAIFKLLLPLDKLLLFIGLAIMVLNGIFGISFGGLIYSISYWIFILGLLLTYANLKEEFLYVGLLGYSALRLIEFIKSLVISGHFFSWSLLLDAAIFGGLGYLVFKRNISITSNQSTIKK